MNKKFAPIIVFTYLRFTKLKTLINKLKKNKESKMSDIYFFSDNSKHIKDKKKIFRIRKYLKNIKGFKKKKIILRNSNYGNGKNIIDGVTYVLKKEKSAIILEDDLIIGRNFLNFMNTCLEKYKPIKKVWHIGGWSFDLNRDSKYDIFFSKNMQPWGWATWQNRWKHFEKNPKKLIKYFENKNDKIFEFNLNDTVDSFKQILDNYNNKKDTWAIFWNAQIFKNNALCVSPHKSLVKTNGFDYFSTNVHPNHFTNIVFKTNINKKNKFNLPDKVIEDKDFNKDFRDFYFKKIGFFFRVKKSFKVLKKNLFQLMSI